MPLAFVPLPYGQIRAFKWGTLRFSSLSGSTLMRHQTWKYEFAEPTDFLRFSIQNRARCEGRKLPGCKIFNGSMVMTIQSCRQNYFTSFKIQSLAEQTDFLRFSIQNRARCEGRKLPKSYVKSTIFSSIAGTNVENLSMSFGCKIFNGSGVTSHQIWKCKFPY